MTTIFTCNNITPFDQMPNTNDFFYPYNCYRKDWNIRKNEDIL